MKVLAEIQTARQKVTLASQGRHVGLLVNGSLQFHSGDQAPLHELLVALPLCLHSHPRSVLVLGGGIGLTAREALRYAEVERLVLVEIDGQLHDLARTHPVMRALHNDAFTDPRVQVVIGDAFAYVAQTTERFDLVVNAVDVSYTPQDQEVSEQAIRQLWRAERGLLNENGWLSDCMNDVEIKEYFARDTTRALKQFPDELGEGMATAFSVYYRGAHAGAHVFAAATLETQPPSQRRSIPAGCAFLDDRLVRRILQRGSLPGHRPR